MVGEFYTGDLCSFEISPPEGFSRDNNDVLSVRLELLKNTKATLMKGDSIDTATSIYRDVGPG